MFNSTIKKYEKIDGVNGFQINDVELNSSIFVEQCKNTEFIINKKCKSITFNNCLQSTLIFNKVISTVEIINSKNIIIYCLDSAPGINIDNCFSVKIYLAKERNVDIITSKSSDVNITYIQDDGSYAKDTPITTQFITQYDYEQNKFITKPYEMFI